MNFSGGVFMAMRKPPRGYRLGVVPVPDSVTVIGSTIITFATMGFVPDPWAMAWQKYGEHIAAGVTK